MPPVDRWNDATPFYSLLGSGVSVQTVLVRALLLFMVVDIVCGFGCAKAGLKINSAATFRGMLKKGGVLMLILLATVLEGVVGVLFKVQYPLIFNEAITAFFIAWELTSITENLAILGVPIPESWVAALSKLREADHGAAAQLVKLDPSQVVRVKTAGEPLKVVAAEPLAVKTAEPDRLAVTQTDAPQDGHNEDAADAPQG